MKQSTCFLGLKMIILWLCELDLVTLSSLFKNWLIKDLAVSGKVIIFHLTSEYLRTVVNWILEAWDTIFEYYEHIL